jgi:hypothetical protein
LAPSKRLVAEEQAKSSHAVYPAIYIPAKEYYGFGKNIPSMKFFIRFTEQ